MNNKGPGREKTPAKQQESHSLSLKEEQVVGNIKTESMYFS